MYSIFLSIVLLFKFHTAFGQDLASDKETLKKSLKHVDEFLKKVGQRIETERDFLQNAGRRTGSAQRSFTTSAKPVTINGISNEDYAKLWFGGNKFNDTPKTIRMRASDEYVAKEKEKFSNFYKAIATLDNEEVLKGTTMKLVNAVLDLRGLVESDIDVKTKSNVKTKINPTKMASLRQLQEEIKSNNKRREVKKANVNITKSKRDNDGNNDEFDVFGGMEFPEDSNLPSAFTPKPTRPTGGGTTPEILLEKFLKEHSDMPGPGVDAIMTPSTTTDDYERVLDPRDFGYSTTRKPISTYGDIQAPPFIDVQYLTTTQAPNAFVTGLKADMEKFHMGVLSIALAKLFHMVIWKSQAEAKRLAYGFGMAISQIAHSNMHSDFGPPILYALDKVSNQLIEMPFDELRSEIVMLHNALLHRRELFSGDVNSLLDHMDTLYTKTETRQLLESLEPLDNYNEPNDVPNTILNTVIDNILAPWKRIKNTARGKILKDAIAKALQNHFSIGDSAYFISRRAMTINIPVKFIPRYRTVGSITPPRPVNQNFEAGNIQVYSIDTRRDDLDKKNVPVEIIPGYKPVGRVTPPRPAQNFEGDNIQVYSIDTRRDDLNKKNIPVGFIPRYKNIGRVTPVRPAQNFAGGNVQVYSIDTRRDDLNKKNNLAEIMPGYKPIGRLTPPKPAQSLGADNIQVYSIDTRRDDLRKNIYKTDLQTIYNNFMRNKLKNQANKQFNTDAKPQFNKQLKDNMNNFNKKEVDNKQTNNLFNRISEKANVRINLNAKVTSKPNSNRIMIIANNNRAKSNIVNKPETVFRTGNSLVDFNNMLNLNDTLIQDANQFQLDMYPDMPMMVPDAPPPPPPPPPPQPSELNFQIEGDRLNLQVDGDKIVINKKNDVPGEEFGEDGDLKMTSSASSALRVRKHHKRHHRKHKRTHGHNLKAKLAKIKKIVKMYRSGHKKHKHHHKRSKHKKSLKSLSINQSPLNTTSANHISDRRFQFKDSLSSRVPLLIANMDYTTQVYAVKNNFMNNLRRRMDRKNVNFKQGSDEEIALRRRLYKAMSLPMGRPLPRRDMRRVNKRILRDSSERESDEEAQLKNKIYSYFNNIQPE